MLIATRFSALIACRLGACIMVCWYWTCLHEFTRIEAKISIWAGLTTSGSTLQLWVQQVIGMKVGFESCKAISGEFVWALQTSATGSTNRPAVLLGLSLRYCPSCTSTLYCQDTMLNLESIPSSTLKGVLVQQDRTKGTNSYHIWGCPNGFMGWVFCTSSERSGAHFRLGPATHQCMLLDQSSLRGRISSCSMCLTINSCQQLSGSVLGWLGVPKINDSSLTFMK